MIFHISKELMKYQLYFIFLFILIILCQELKPKINKNNILNYIKDNQSIKEHLEDIYIYFNDEDEFKSDLFFVFDS